MKMLATLALNLTWCAYAAGQCVIVLDTKPSARNAKIAVLLDGKRKGNAKLIINLPAGQGSRSMVTDSQGAAVLNDLPVGTSCITATAEHNLSVGLCLEVVSAQFTSEISFFRMTLAVKPQQFNSVNEKVKRIEQSPPALHLSVPAGVVLDQDGGVISKAEIQIYRRGSYPREPLKKIKTNEAGRFSDSLEPGVYTVIVRRSGFQPEVNGVEISPAGKGDELQLTLQVGPTDTCDEAI